MMDAAREPIPAQRRTDGALVREVQNYYDINTAAFARFGQSGRVGAIRRAVWGPGVRSRAEAFHYVDRLILREIRDQPWRVLDLGCGLGSSLLYLAARTPITGVGVTISSVQAERAQAYVHAAGFEQRVQCLEADFGALPAHLTRSQLAFSIEAFIHAPSATRYFEAAASQLLPGGTLIVCDDVLAPRAATPRDMREARWLEDYRNGWLAHSLLTERSLCALAERAGFELAHSLDLTPFLELERPRDRLLRGLLPLIKRLPIPQLRRRSLVGGDALQRALVSGLLEYRCLTWRLRS